MSASKAGDPPAATSAPDSSPAKGKRAPNGHDSAARASAASGDSAVGASAREGADSALTRSSALVALAVGALFLLIPVGWSGIWDPFEINVADLARRIAVNTYGAASLALAGADNSMPKLGDLGRGELPFDSIALGLRVFGMHEWAGRLPLAIWGLVGVLSLYWLLARLVDKKAGLYGAVVLSTMPLYFMQARTMLGDIVTMATIAMALAGLGVVIFDGPGVSRARLASGALGMAGLVLGFLARGLLIGVALPALGAGLAWGVVWAAGQRKADRVGDVAGLTTLATGAVAAAMGTNALFRGIPPDYSMAIGATLAVPSKFPTFDLVIHYLGHSLFPWSAFIPFAVGRVFRTPVASDEGNADGETKASAVRIMAIVGSAVAFGIYSLMAPRVGYLAFGAPCLLAAIAAITIRDFERGAPASRAVGVGVAVFTALFLRDYLMFPEKGLSAFAVSAPTFPDSFKDRGATLVLACSAIFVVMVFFAWLEERNRPWFEREDYLQWPRSLVSAWGGNLFLALAAVEGALALLALNTYVAMHFLHSKWIAPVGLQIRVAMLNAFWIAPAALFLTVWGAMALRDAFRFFFDKTGVSRAAATALAGVAAAGVLSFAYYPALGAQLSPREVFESYSTLQKGGEPLGLLGISAKSASYYPGIEAKPFTEVSAAYSWLTGGPERRWLAVRNDDLGKLNALFRSRPGPKQNLPVLNARSSQNMLVSNVLESSERNQSPFQSYVLDSEPAIPHRAEANLQDQVISLGWDVTDASGKSVEYVVPARKYHFRLFYRVLSSMLGDWETFIHIDGFHRRFNGDHKTLGGKYPFSLWQPGDYIVDDYEFSLEPNFTAGTYNVYYGLFQGDTRLKIKTGKSDDNRIDGGTIRVQ